MAVSADLRETRVATNIWPSKILLFSTMHDTNRQHSHSQFHISSMYKQNTQFPFFSFYQKTSIVFKFQLDTFCSSVLTKTTQLNLCSSHEGTFLVYTSQLQSPNELSSTKAKCLVSLEWCQFPVQIYVTIDFDL